MFDRSFSNLKRSIYLKTYSYLRNILSLRKVELPRLLDKNDNFFHTKTLIIFSLKVLIAEHIPATSMQYNVISITINNYAHVYSLIIYKMGHWLNVILTKNKIFN